MVKAAKKRKREEDEEFRVPEFDEVAYMKKEIEAARLAVVVIVLAIPIAVGLWALTLAGVSIVAFFLGLGVTIYLPRILPILPWPKLNLSAFERKDWLGPIGTFFFSWLAFWILLLNPPFIDLTSPVIQDVTVNGTAVARDGQTPPVPPGSVEIRATILENVGLSFVEFRVGPTVVLHSDLGGSRYGATYNASMSLPVRISARDLSGHETVFGFTLAIG